MINYAIIDESIKFYEAKGFRRIETPWTVSEDIINLTKPPDKQSFKLEHNGKCLVGSGEQSFLYLYLKGFLPKGMFQTVTPCFRDDKFTKIHTKYFIKNELIVTDEVSSVVLEGMIETCSNFFETILSVKPDVVPTSDGYDIVCGDIELGSYGIRKNDFLSYVYGTGVAEPRASFCKNIIKWGIIKEK